MKYVIEFNDILSIFYKDNNDKVLCKIFKDGRWGSEQLIVSNCKRLISVSSVTTGKIYIIIESLSNELILYSFINEEYNRNILIKSMFLYDSIKILSVKNILNLFYTEKVNNKCILYHRTIRADLTISVPFMLDIIDGDMEDSFLLSYKEDKIYLGYIKKLNLYSIGYKIFNVIKNKWTDFEIIESIATKIESFSMVMEENINFYGYIINNENIGYFKYGFKTGEVQKSNFIQDLTSKIKYCNLFIFDKKLYLSYVTSKKFIINTLSYNKSLSKMSEVIIEEKDLVNKYRYDCYNNNINYIIIIQKEDIYSDILLASKEKKVQEDARIEFSEVQGYDVDIDKLERNIFEKQQTINKLNNTINELREKINIYMEEIKKLKIENAMEISDKSKIENNISTLYDEVLQRETTLLELQNNIIQYKNINKEQKNKIDDMVKEIIRLKDVNKNLDDKYNQIINSDVKKIEEENIRLKNEILSLNNKNQHINKEIKKIKYMNKSLEDRYNNFINNDFKKIENENIVLMSEILDFKSKNEKITEDLKRSNEINKELENKYSNFANNDFNKIQEENLRLKNQILSLNSEMKILKDFLENQNTKQSLLKKLFKDI